MSLAHEICSFSFTYTCKSITTNQMEPVHKSYGCPSPTSPLCLFFVKIALPIIIFYLCMLKQFHLDSSVRQPCFLYICELSIFPIKAWNTIFLYLAFIISRHTAWPKMDVQQNLQGNNGYIGEQFASIPSFLSFSCEILHIWLTYCQSPDFKKSNRSNKKIWIGTIIR